MWTTSFDDRARNTLTGHRRKPIDRGRGGTLDTAGGFEMERGRSNLKSKKTWGLF